MKKFLGVLVAITLCACMLVPMASATEEAGLSDILAEIAPDVDLGALTETDLSEIIGGLGLENIDIEALLSGDSDALASLEDAIDSLEGKETTAAQASGSTTETTGGLDLSWLTGLLGGSMDTSAITDMLGGLGAGDLDSLLGTVSGAFSGAGVDLDSAELGSDVAASAGGNDMMATIMDTLFSGLELLGLDTSMIEGMLDNDIVNFFANMYIGYVGQVEEPTTEEPTVVTTTKKKPPVVTTKTPDTGDTSAVFAAIATLTVASAAAFVCLKKKEN